MLNKRASIRPFKISVSDSEIHDLHQRLDHARWPEEATVSDWSQGVPLSVVQDLCAYWRHDYDWRRCEDVLNSYPHFKTEIDGVDIHFWHIRSKHHDALPMIMTNGWPESIVTFLKLIDPLIDPTRHGGKAEDAFHLIIPSMPGYGFSGKPKKSGWTSAKMAVAWAELMGRLGYTRYVAQGGDWGADIVAELASNSPPPALVAVHFNTLFFDAKKETSQAKGRLTEGEQHALALLEKWDRAESAYMLQYATRPQTLGYALSDSPSGLLAWIFEKISAWSQDEPGKHKDVLTMLTKDEILDNVMVYWWTNTLTSSTRLYWENPDACDLPIRLPVGVSQFQGENGYVPKHWAERYYSNIVHWHELKKGGHFAPWTVPQLFVKELRECFALVR
ncbi:putative epoxide hydrolase [Cyphellophora attinorum]|uniref:Putative epoxide hydrolase n=1 Tax=Cyphellophora attinorum TaxID=1664694 RepID=A0A0N0NHC2_9EURO|nr:putative epoxide hydrolase [Phialophora attinorum]KPI34521.1 putative epoxide hydrolase [Phialophora attinorum]